MLPARPPLDVDDVEYVAKVLVVRQSQLIESVASIHKMLKDVKFQVSTHGATRSACVV